MRRASPFIAVALAVVALLSACAPPRRAVTGWVPYWSTDSGRTTIDTARDLLSEVSPFWYRATDATTFANDEPAADQAAVVAQARAAHLPLIPAVRDGMAAHGMAAVLADPAQRAAHVDTRSSTWPSPTATPASTSTTSSSPSPTAPRAGPPPARSGSSSSASSALRSMPGPSS